MESESAAATLLKAREEFSEIMQKNILFKSEMDVMRERNKSAETEAGRMQREVAALETRGEEVGVWARKKDEELRLCRQKLQSETVRRKQCLAESEKMQGQLAIMKEEKEETTLTCTKTEQEKERLLTEKKMWTKERERMLRERRECERREEEESGWRERMTTEMATTEEKFISTMRREEEMTFNLRLRKGRLAQNSLSTKRSKKTLENPVTTKNLSVPIESCSDSKVSTAYSVLLECFASIKYLRTL